MPFDPSTAKLFDPSTATLVEEEEELKQAPKKNWMDKVIEAIVPSASEEAAKKTTPLTVAKTAGKAVLDIEGAPTRAIATLRGQEMSDPTAYFLKPETQKIHSAIDRYRSEGEFVQEPQQPELMRQTMEALQGGKEITPGAFMSGPSSSDDLKGAVELTGSTLSDPLLIGGLLKGAAGKIFKGAGKRIEKSVLGKGSKRILKEQGKSLDDAVTGALEHGLGGDMAHVIEKSQGIIDDLEDSISKLTKSYKGPKKVNVEYQFHKARKHIKDHPELFLTDRKEVEAAIDAIEKNFDSYGLTGNISVDKAQQLKRMLKVKGVPNQTTPASQDAIFGLRMAFADAVREIVPEIDKYNATYREIMPALKIAADRLPTEQARDIIGLGTLGASGLGAMLSGGASLGAKLPLAIGGNILYQGSKSGRVAQGAYNLGKAIESIPTFPPIGGTTVGVRNIMEKGVER